MSKVTLIKDLTELTSNSHSIITDKDQESLSNMIVDLSLELQLRISVIELFFKQFGQEQSNELINKLSMMYQFSGTKLLEKYLYEICTNCEISSLLKLTAAKSLCSFDPKKEIGYKALDIVCQTMSDVATPCKIDAICLLMCHKTYKLNAKKYFCNIINNNELDCEYRYKTILSLENKDISEKSYFIKESALEFFDNTSNRTLYRILSGQYLIQKCKISNTKKEYLELTILSFAQDNMLDYNLRADAADVILSLGSAKNKTIAREIIMILGRQDGNVKTIFDNAQNVHVDEIEQSVLVALEFLAGIDIKTISGVPGTPKITFEYVKQQILDELEKSKPVEPKDYKIFIKLKDGKKKQNMGKKKHIIIYKEEKEKYDTIEDKINVSLNRIYMDRALYSKYNCSLLHILLKIWTYLTSHKSENDMKTRLLEELIDMSGTCSSGFASRLVNVISGFGDFNLTISWRDQIIANFTGRLNAKARDLTLESQLQQNGKLYDLSRYVCSCCDIKENELSNDKKHRKKLLELLETFQGNVLEEMSLNCNDFSIRKNFLRFFRKNMLPIRQELYEEFKEYITDTDFDLYFRSAIATYETGGYV